MRGKLRDKRADAKRDYLKHEVIERKRANKRTWLTQQMLEEEEDLLDIEDDDEMEVPVPKQPIKK
jgi:hypothetical protein